MIATAARITEAAWALRRALDGALNDDPMIPRWEKQMISFEARLRELDAPIPPDLFRPRKG